MCRKIELPDMPKDGLTLIQKNMRIAYAWRFSLEKDYLFYTHVRTHGIWDYKSKMPGMADFGNFHYGAVGIAAGYPASILLRAAGWYQERSKTSLHNDENDWGHYYSLCVASMDNTEQLNDKPPFSYCAYGDDPNDQDWIKKGIKYGVEVMQKGIVP